MNQGWVKLYRKFSDSDFWLSEPFTKPQAWVDLIMLANHKEKMISIRGIDLHIKRGVCARSELTLCKRWKWSRNKVRKFLKALQKRGKIEQQKNNVTSLIYIKNYDQYQNTVHQTEHQKDTKKYTNKNDKNDKNLKLPKGNYLSETSDKVKSLPCPHQKIRDLYNQILGSTLPYCKSSNKTFEKMLKARWREDPERQNLEWWKEFFNYIFESDFLMGRTDSPYTASFDWIIKPTNMSKILNGNYNNRVHNEHSLNEYAKEHGLL